MKQAPYTPWPSIIPEAHWAGKEPLSDGDRLHAIRRRMEAGETPTCPKCGSRCFVPLVGWRTEQGIYWFCTDMGHWVGGYDEVVWEREEPQ